MSLSPNSSPRDPERAFALQKYYLLDSQHTALQRRLQQISASAPATTTTTPSRSPERLRQASISSHSSSGSSESPSSPTMRGGSVPHLDPQLANRRPSLPTIIDESITAEIEEEEMKLLNVNQQIKTTLTELLNCGSVRGDRRYRMWIQERLMDAERELKGSRSRSSTRRRSRDVMAMF